MRTLFIILTLVLIGTVSGLLYSGSARAEEVMLDQEQTEQNTWGMVGDNPHGQVFTAGRFGSLERVSVYLANYLPSPPTGYVVASIQTVTSDGYPSGIEIGWGEIPADQIHDSAAWVDIDIINRPIVFAETTYTLLISTIGANPSTSGGIVRWYFYQNNVGDDPYPRGYMVLPSATDTWRIDPSLDSAFKTYVRPDELDQQQTRYTHARSSSPGEQFGQTFTAGKSGALDRVSVFFFNESFNPVSILNVSIQTVTENGYPSGLEIGHGSFFPSSNAGWINIGISRVIVTAGQQYAIVLSSPQGQFEWYWDSFAHYSGGQMVFNDGSGWTTYTDVSDYDGVDAVFETYVLPAQPMGGAGPGGDQADDDDGSGCFIATAAYGSYWEPHVMTLRQFRDEYLLTNKLGTHLVDVYYKYSTPMADYIAEHDSLRAIVRTGLTPLIGFSWLAVNYGITAAFAIMFGILSLIIGGTFFWVKLRETT